MQQSMPIQLLSGQKKDSSTDFAQALPVNVSGVVKKILNVDGYMLQQPGLTLFGPAGEPTESVTYIALDGLNQSMLRGAALTGAAATKFGTIACRIRIAAAASGNRYIFEGTGAAVVCRFQLDPGTNILRINIENVTGGNIAADVRSNVGFTSADGWLDILASWDCLNDTEGQLYVNNVNVYLTTSDLDNEDLGYAVCTNWAIGSQVDTASKFDGDIMFLWFDITTAIDFAVEANRRLFFDADGCPVDLGANGEIPTGTAPIIYLTGDSAPTNKGTGGGFTLTGTLTSGTFTCP